MTATRMNLHALIDSFDWTILHHAYGRARSTPGLLRELLREGASEEGVRRGRDHLTSAIMHQGRVYPATGPVLQVLAQGLRERVGAAPCDDPVSEFLVSYLTTVTEELQTNVVPEDELETMARFDLLGFLQEQFAQTQESDDDVLSDEDQDDFEGSCLYDSEEATKSLLARGLLGCRTALPAVEAALRDHAARTG